RPVIHQASRRRHGEQRCGKAREHRPVLKHFEARPITPWFGRPGAHPARPRKPPPGKSRLRRSSLKVQRIGHGANLLVPASVGSASRRPCAGGGVVARTAGTSAARPNVFCVAAVLRLRLPHGRFYKLSGEPPEYWTE